MSVLAFISMDIDVKPGLQGPPVFCCAPLGRARLGPAEASRAALLFKALADPHRVQIVNLLAIAGEPVCVCDLVAVLGVSQPTVSHHLKKLMSAGLLRREQRGAWAYYSIEPAAFTRLAELVSLPSGAAERKGISGGTA